MELEWIDDTDGQSAADALVANHARLIEAEVAEFVLAAHWADLHDARSVASGPRSGRVLPGSERVKQAGGTGTSMVGEFAAAELGCLLGRSNVAASILIADAVDVRHRLPRLWDQLKNGRVRVWQSRHVASRTRAVGLTLEQARAVDAATTPYLGSLPWSRFQDLLEAKIIETDPEGAESRRIAAAMERFVATGQCNEYGLKTVIAKAAGGDAIYFVAVCDRIAQILLLEGDTDPVGARRSKALGILADPARALALFTKYETDPVVEPVETTPHPDPAPVVEFVETTPHPDPDPVVEPVETTPNPRAPQPATLYLHLSKEAFDAALADEARGVVRMEGVGPITVAQAREFLRHANVTIRPVIDLAADHPVDSYEVPTRMREQLHLRTPSCMFPFSGNLSRRKDADHTTPYLEPARGGPPGQTRIGNLGPLGRTAHRVKTHAPGWRHHQPSPGVHLWRTPHGYWYRVDGTGTHALGQRAFEPATPAETALAKLLTG